MALFNKQNDPAMAKHVNGSGPDGINMVAEGTVLEGTLRASGDVRISGRIVGTLEVEGKLIVAPEGYVEGEVRATQADVAGTIRAHIRVAERLVLRSTAVVEGDVQTGRFVVEEGAEYTGQCEMGTLRRSAGDGAQGDAAQASAAKGASPRAEGAKDAKEDAAGAKAPRAAKAPRESA